MGTKNHPNCQGTAPLRDGTRHTHLCVRRQRRNGGWPRPQNGAHLCRLETTGKWCQLSSIKWRSPADHMVWEANRKEMAGKKNPCRKARAYRTVPVADEDLPWCVWHQCCWPLSPAACRMPPVLVPVSSLLQVCVEGKRVCWHPYGVAQPQGPAQALPLVGFAKFILKTVSNCEMQRVATVVSPETHPKRCQVEGQVGLGAPIFSNDQHLPAATQFQFWPCRILKLAILGHRWVWNTVMFWVIQSKYMLIFFFFQVVLFFLYNRLVC